MYYYGFEVDGTGHKMTSFELVKAVVIDLFTVVGAIITLHKSTHYHVNKQGDVPLSESASASSIFPTLPVAIVGFWLLAATHFKVRNIWAILGGGILMIVLPGLTLSLVLVYHSPLRKGGLWALTLINYVYLAVPFLAFLPLQKHFPLVLLITVGCFMARVGYVAIGSISDARIISPFCQRSQSARVFGWIYLMLGIIASLLALIGRYRMYRLPPMNFAVLRDWGRRQRTQQAELSIPGKNDEVTVQEIAI